VRLALALTQALDHLHSHGLVHRDEKQVRCDVGTMFNVRHALAGRVATNPPGQVRIELSLIQNDGDRKIWSETFAGSTNNVVELETRALRWAEPSLQQTPLDFMLVSLVAQCLIACQRPKDVIALLEKGLAPQKRQDLASVLACAYAKMGDRTQATNLLEELKMESNRAYVQSYCVARVVRCSGPEG
jgi:predicted Zn-dependent protease